ncbi:MAG: metallophosphoesterase family protein [Bacteroidota bacterium]|nr:metallophosphoesterase family protein [Bacteroidota bacterium]
MGLIGLIGDTHGYIDDRIMHHLADCDEIWHTGDWGPEPVETKLNEYKPVRGVYGNIDDHRLRLDFPEYVYFNYQGLQVFMIHISGPFGSYAPRVKEVLKGKRPGLFICGHSHILKVQRDPKYKFLYINPGAAGLHGFHKVRTLIKLKIEEGKVLDIAVVELGPRAKEELSDELDGLFN